MTEAPSPSGVSSYDELADRLRSLRVWAGISYRELHRQVVRYRRDRGVPELPAYDTVYRCLRPGRARLDTDLVLDIVRVLLGDEPGVAGWRQACQAAAGQADEASVVAVSDTLPPDLAEFTGRDAELERLLGAAEHAAVAAIDGMPGVGKTRLAVHAAHRLVERGRFPDGQLWVDLRGYAADRPPADPAAVLDGFLRRLGVPGGQIVGLDLPARTARFRESLAGKRALIVLDNAASEDQVAPLLPDVPGCFVLVTSRRQLAGLDATRLALDVFSPTEALGLLRATVSDSRIDADPDAATRIVRLAGQLPLAVALVAARIEGTPEWRLSDHVERLTERRTLLRLDDAVEVGLALSYDDLAAEPRRLLRLLALHPGRDIDGYAAAALAATDLRTAEHTLTDLVGANVLQHRSDGRYEPHDLVRVFATVRLHEEEPPRARRAALTRLLDYYRYAAACAMGVFAPSERTRWPAIPELEMPYPTFADLAAATAWLDTERPNLIGAALSAADHGLPDHTADLSLLLFPYLDVAGHFDDAEMLHMRASRTGTGVKVGRAHTQVGAIFLRTGRYEEAAEHLERALAIYRAAGDLASEGMGLTTLGGVRLLLGQFAEAAAHFERALTIAREAGDRAGEALHLGNLGIVYALMGRTAEALECYHEALPITRETGDRRTEGHTVACIGEAYGRLGDYPRALRHIEQGLAIARETNNRIGIADTQNQLGTVRSRLGEYDRALELHQDALAIARDGGLRELEVQSLNCVGTALHGLGEPNQALEYHQQALGLARELGDKYQQARAHDGLGHAYELSGEHTTAREHWRQAYAIFTELGMPEANDVEPNLRAVEA